MSRSSDPGNDPEREESDEFIDDLESIKDLLNEAELQIADTQDVPLLDDQIDSSVQERLGDDTFETLLSDAWRDSVEDLFEDTRARIAANSTDWLPEHTDELAEALKIRIDASVKAWLQETLEANIHRLRERIVAELSIELLTHMRDKLSKDNPNNT